MAKVIKTENITERTVFNPDHASWVYNGLDCCVTFEVRNELARQLEAEPDYIRDLYRFALDKQAVFLEMSLRGIRVDPKLRQDSIDKAEEEIGILKDAFRRICEEGAGCALNPNSPVQLKNFFYGHMGLKPIKARNSKGEYAPSVNRDSLEKLAANYMMARPFVNFILAIRDLSKQIGFLKAELDEDGRMRSSYHVVGTNTGRVSSSENEFSTGTNLQNVAERLRRPFIADPGMILVNVDLEQADSRNLGAMIYVNCPREGTFEFKGKTYELNEEFAAGYLDACESGDLHTFVCRMAWANRDWPDDKAGWRALADEIFYREFSYRDMAKRLGHGTNFYGQPRTMAIHTKVDKGIVEIFQNNYFQAFPCIPWYHQWVREQLKNEGFIRTLFNRRRFFFGRWNDDKTLRDAIAYAPQSMTAHEIDVAMLQLWRYNLSDGPAEYTTFPYPIRILNQVHDSILFEIPFSCVQDFVPKVLDVMKCEIDLPGGRKFSVPLEAQVGWSWGKVEKDKQGNTKSNPHGLIKWRGFEDRKPPQYRTLKRLSVRGL